MNKRLSFQSQTVSMFLLTLSLLLFVNLYIYSNMNVIIEGVDQTYMGNKNLIELSGALNELQVSVREYLNTRNTGALKQLEERQFRFSTLLSALSTELTEEDMMQRNIYCMSEYYLSIVDSAVQAKKEREIEQYREYGSQADEWFDYVNTYMNMQNEDLFRVNSDTYTKTLSSVRRAEMLYSVLLVMTGLLDVCLIILLTRRLTRPLNRLADTAREVGQGNLDIRLVESDAQSEIGTVMHAFNQMVGSLREYMEKQQESMKTESALRENAIRMEAYLKDAQLKYLHAQVNPHFLFNTLNAGAQLAMLEDADRTYRYIHKAADFFRYLVRHNEMFVKLQEEIQLVDDYMYILNVRYAGELHYEKEVEEECLNISVPSMILQPLVENCIKHGLQDVDWEKKILVEAYCEQDMLILSIQDNGMGMTREQIEEVRNSTELKKPDGDTGRGIGLDNVKKRLQAYYNMEHVLEIRSAGTGQGTEVIIYIPILDRGTQYVQDHDSR